MEKFKSFIERLKEILNDYEELSATHHIISDIKDLLDEYHIQ